jgi:hypothetical protein
MKNGIREDEALVQGIGDSIIRVVAGTRHPPIIRDIIHKELLPVRSYAFDTALLEVQNLPEADGVTVHDVFYALRHNDLLSRALWFGDLQAIYDRGGEFFQKYFAFPLVAPLSFALDRGGGWVMPVLDKASPESGNSLAIHWRYYQQPCTEPILIFPKRFPRQACPRRDA